MSTPSAAPLHRPSRSPLATWTVRAAGAYILFGALVKVATGTPLHLPITLLDLAPRHPEALFLAVIGVEMFVGVIALLAPRPAWWGVASLLIAFIAVLSIGITRGEELCGCFGAMITPSAWLMLAIDAVFLAALLGVQPWRTVADLPMRPWSAAVALIAVVPSVLYVNSRIASIEGDVGELSETVTGDLNDDGDVGTPESPEGDAPAPPVDDTWRLPAVMPRYVRLEPDRWVGRPLRRTALGTWTDVSRFPDDCRVILFYDTCPHCAEHLRTLAAAPPPEPIVLVQIPSTPNARTPVVVNTLPTGLHVRLPAGPQWSVRAPWEVHVNDRSVRDAVFLEH